MSPVVMVIMVMLVQLRQQALEEERLKREQEEEEAKAQVFLAFMIIADQLHFCSQIASLVIV